MKSNKLVTSFIKDNIILDETDDSLNKAINKTMKFIIENNIYNYNDNSRALTECIELKKENIVKEQEYLLVYNAARDAELRDNHAIALILFGVSNYSRSRELNDASMNLYVVKQEIIKQERECRQIAKLLKDTIYVHNKILINKHKKIKLEFELKH